MINKIYPQMLYRWFLMDIAQWYLGDIDIIWTPPSYGKNTVYLTIDDAVYSPESFDEILEILNKFEVKVTFFVISSYVNESNRELLIKAINSGHHLANHGASNKVHALCNAFELENELLKCEQVLKQLYSDAYTEYPKIKYFRPGCGYTTQTTSYVCKKLDYKIVLGTVYPIDTIIPMPNIYSWFIRYKIKRNDIIILHDRSWTPSTLSKLLPYLTKIYEVDHL
jgi:peptidoglycan/xylan/chitin deacetylase (PgdA/CDA1 family)